MPIRTVAIVAYPGVQSLDVTGPFEVFAGARRAAAAHGIDAGYDISVVAADPGPVTCESGIALIASALPAPDVRLDTLLLPGGGGVENARRDPALVEWVGQIASRARRVATVLAGQAAAALTD